MVRDTPKFQDAFTHQIWNSYLKEYRRYAPDSKQFLETRSEVKVNVTGTQGWCATLCHLKMLLNTKLGIPPNTKFGIPSLNYIEDMLRTRLFWKLDQGQGHSDLKNKWDTLLSQYASTHQIWNSYLKEYRRYALDRKQDGQTDGRTAGWAVRLLYASQSSFGGIESSFVKKIELLTAANPVCINSTPLKKAWIAVGRRFVILVSKWMLRCFLNFNPQSVIRYQQFALWIKRHFYPQSELLIADNWLRIKF